VPPSPSPGRPSALAQDSIYIEELTWTEISDAIRAGRTTVTLPTGGTERNGPYMVRPDKRANMGGFEGSGVTGDPTKASVELGKIGIQFKVDVTLEALKKSMAAR
jgi:creatinine amidohydrolase/Fe(II)-dependent formamide hydrolase-like protein